MNASRSSALLLCLVALSTPVPAHAQTPPPASEAFSPQAAAQIAALLAEKASRTPAQQKIDSQLLYAARMARGQAVAPGVPVLETGVAAEPDGRVLIDVRAQVSDALLGQMRGLGADVIFSHPAYDDIRLQVAFGQLEAIAALPQVRFIMPAEKGYTASQPARPMARSGPASPPMDRGQRERQRQALVSRVRAALSNGGADGEKPVTNVGGVQSEGDKTHLTAALRTKFNVDGTGVKIGVLSDGVDGLAQSQGSGDLPTVTVLPGQSGSGAEGTAMLEIIHDLAPGATLFFATATNSVSGFAQNILDLRNVSQCDIIVDDVLFDIESPFQDGQVYSSPTNGAAVTQAVRDVVAAGALYFAAAGNFGNKARGSSGTWEGDFVDGGAATSPLPFPGRVHDFGMGQTYDILKRESKKPGRVVLFWNDPLGGSAQDYDLFRLEADGSVVLSSSTNIQNGGTDPYERIPPSVYKDERLVIVRTPGSQTRFLHLDALGGELSRSTAGQIHGHNATSSPNSFAVGATPALPTGPYPTAFNSSSEIEPDSSDGKRRIYFDNTGSLLTPGNITASGGQVLNKPDFTAADNVSVTGNGGFAVPFTGTSAAAPHAAALAALIKSLYPAYTPTDIRLALVNNALDIEDVGWDAISGAGVVMGQWLGSYSKTLPANNAIGTQQLITLTWAASEGATNYQYCIDTTNDDNCDGDWTSVGNALSVSVSNLPANKTFYWQVRAWHDSLFEEANAPAPTIPPSPLPALGTWWNFTTQNPIQWTAFPKNSPSGSIGSVTSVQLNWTASPWVQFSGPSYYAYCVDTIDNGNCDTFWQQVFTSSSNGNFTLPTISGLTPGTRYYWQVSAGSGSTLADCPGVNCGKWFSFYTTGNGPPGGFVKIAPANNSGTGTNVTLAWGPSLNTSNLTTHFEYCVDPEAVSNNVCDQGWLPVVAPDGLATWVAINGLVPSTAYYWQVRAVTVDAMGVPVSNTEANGGAWWKLTTGPAAPAAFSKLSPSHQAGQQGSTVALQWRQTNAASYLYCFATAPGCTPDIPAFVIGQGLMTAKISGLQFNTTYYWQVQALNANNLTTPANNGIYWSFSTAAFPAVVTGAASGILETSAYLNATVNPNGTLTNGVFEYGLTTSYGSQIGMSTSGNGNSPVPSSILVVGLACATQYHFHAFATNQAGRGDAPTESTFTTLACPPPGNYVQGGTFDNGLGNWQTFATPDLNYISAAVSNGELEFSRVPAPPGTSNQATVFQQTGVALPIGVQAMAQFDLGNTSSVRKYIKVLLIDSDFSDFAACTFWLPPNAGLLTYQLMTHTTKAWANASIYFYAGTPNAPGDTGVYQVDNVSVQYVPGQPSSHTDCIDPRAPVPPGGPPGPNLLTNGDFGTNALAPWTTFGTITAQAPAGVLQMIRPTSILPAGVVKQQTSSTVIQPMTAGQLLTASFQLGNSSGVRKRVTAIMHDNDFSDLVACVFWLAPGQALSNYSIVGWASKAWADATLSFYAATIGPDQWTLVDNVVYQRTPGAAITGSTCNEPIGSSAVQPNPRLITSAAPAAGSGVARATSVIPNGAARIGPVWISDGAFDLTVGGTAWEAVAATTGVSALRVADLIDLRNAERATLRAHSWLTRGTSRAAVQVRTAGGSEWVTVAEVPVSDTWQPIEVDLTAFVGDQIELQFLFDGVASLDVNAPDSWHVDDIRVETEP